MNQILMSTIMRAAIKRELAQPGAFEIRLSRRPVFAFRGNAANGRMLCQGHVPFLPNSFNKANYIANGAATCKDSAFARLSKSQAAIGGLGQPADSLLSYDSFARATGTFDVITCDTCDR